MIVWQNVTSLSARPQEGLSLTPITVEGFIFSFVPFVNDVESRLRAYMDAFPGGAIDPDFERASIESWRAAEDI